MAILGCSYFSVLSTQADDCFLCTVPLKTQRALNNLQELLGNE